MTLPTQSEIEEFIALLRSMRGSGRALKELRPWGAKGQMKLHPKSCCGNLPDYCYCQTISPVHSFKARRRHKKLLNNEKNASKS